MIVFVLTLCMVSCADQPKKEETRVAPIESAETTDLGYDFSRAEVANLKKKLREISGIAVLEEGKLAAVQDESGIIYILDEKSGEVLETIDFAGKGDYEDIAVNAEYFFVLESSGTIYRVPRKGGAEVESYALGGKKKKEFESLYLDGNKLVLVCKACGRDDKSKEAYCFDLKKLEFESSTCLTIDLNDVLQKMPAGTLLKPSAAAINPVDQKLYVLCSVGKTLLRCSKDGAVEETFPLDEKLFRQPEGICFKPDGTMIISNEGAGLDATLVKISFNK
jgi:uncharacterized protein YjiK